VASKLLGSFSIREKGVGGYEQLDGGHGSRDILQLTESDLPGLGFSSIAQGHFVSNLKKLKAKKSSKPAGSTIATATAVVPNAKQPETKATNSPNALKDAAKQMTKSPSRQAAGASVSAAPVKSNGNGNGTGPSLESEWEVGRSRDELTADWKQFEGVVFEIRTTFEHLSVRDGRQFTDPFIADKSLSWRVLPLRRKLINSDSVPAGQGSGPVPAHSNRQLCEWYFLISPVVLPRAMKYDLEFVVQVSAYSESGSTELMQANGPLPLFSSWYAQDGGGATAVGKAGAAGRVAGMMFRLITDPAAASDFLHIRIKYLVVV